MLRFWVSGYTPFSAIPCSFVNEFACDKPHYPFELPKGWCWTTLSEITSIIGDGLHGTPQYDSSGNYYFINGNNLANRKIVIKEETKRISYDEYIKYRKPLNESTIFVSINGTIGNVGTYNGEKVILGKSACFFNLLPFLFKEYICSIIESDYFRKYALKSATGSTIKNVPLKAINDFYIPIAPLQEQMRIVGSIKLWLSLVNSIEENKDNLQDTIKQAKSKILDLAIHGKLVTQDPTDEPAYELLKRINPKAEITCDNPQYGMLPKGWCGCSFSDIFEITMGQSPTGCSINHQHGVEFHQGKISFGDKYLMQSDTFTDEPTKLAEPNSLLLCVRAPVGVVNITQRKICIGRGLCSLKTNAAILLDYAYHALTTYQSTFESQSTGSTFKAISGNIIRNERFALPPINEQHRIVAKIEELFSQLDNITSSI